MRSLGLKYQVLQMTELPLSQNEMKYTKNMKHHQSRKAQNDLIQRYHDFYDSAFITSRMMYNARMLRLLVLIFDGEYLYVGGMNILKSTKYKNVLKK
jgi:hypothetical protein